MAYKLRLAQEGDAASMVEVQESDPSAYSRALYPGGLTSALLADKAAKMRAAVSASGTVFMVAVTAHDPMQIVGIAKWRVFEQPEDLSNGLDVTQSAGQNVRLVREFQEQQRQGRLKHVAGIPYIRLSNLFVTPEHQRRGVGSQLLEHGLALADEKRLPAYVEATARAAPLYARFGFVELSTFEIPLAVYTDGRESETHVHSLMLRPARDGVRQVQRGHRKTYSFQRQEQEQQQEQR